MTNFVWSDCHSRRTILLSSDFCLDVKLKLVHQSHEFKQQRQISYIRLSAEVMAIPILYTINK